MSALLWTIAALVVVPAVYAVLSAVVLLYVRVPNEPHFALLEDLLLVATAPFVGAVVAFTLARRDR